MRLLFNKFKLTRVIEKEQRYKNREKNTIFALKCLRLSIHVLLGIVVLATAIISKISLLSIANFTTHKSKNDDSEAANQRWVWILLLTVVSPHLISFCLCFFKILCRQVPNPTVVEFLIALLFETIESIGACILVFGVFPHLDIVRSILITNAISVLPSFLRLFTDAKTDRRLGDNKSSSSSSSNSLFYFLFVRTNLFKYISMRRLKKLLKLNMSVLAVLMQSSVFVIAALLNYSNQWSLPIGIILTSFGVMWNYLGNSDKVNNQFLNTCRTFKRRIQKSRHKIGLFTNLLKVGITLLICQLFNPQFGFKTVYIDHLSSDLTLIGLFTPFLVQLISSLVFYGACSLAFKFRMSRMSFALPLTLATPLSIALVLILHSVPSLPYWIDYFRFSITYSHTIASYKLHLIYGLVLWWLSHLWITKHIWIREEANSMETTIKRPFNFQQFSNIYAENSLMLSCSIRDKFDCKEMGEKKKTDDKNGIDKEAEDKNTRTMLYICATMWHENENEMLQLLKSIFRLDIDQLEKNVKSQLTNEKYNKDCFDYEAHIFFDDAINYHFNGSSEPNTFVQSLIKIVEEAAMFAHERQIVIEPPVKTPTPYGGRLKFSLPGGNSLIVHLKDKSKIRNKKRWSQVMYIFYLLGYKCFGGLTKMEELYEKDPFDDKEKKKKNEFIGFGNLLKNIDSRLRKRLENTFILTLDGDVEFRANAVRLMIDKMKENKKIGSVCGRVHPIGSGPIVWYQKFEYAVGHWLQKVSEHVFGTVMCSPGCFSLLRGSTILEDQILAIYATKSTEANHYVQYDQGEDRWLSTLIIQQGYYIAYSSAACSYTYSPETFNEYFNQRRRWIPSTMANLIDFLNDFKHILKVNDRITVFFVFYISLNFIASLLGPSTVLLMIIDTFMSGFDMSLWGAYLITILPVIVYVILCYNLKSETQIKIAVVLGTLFAFVMITMILGTVARILNSPIINPSGVLLYTIVIVFVVAALLHPREFNCLYAGLLYYLGVPVAFVLLNIYAIINLNNVSWGTRETKTSHNPDHLCEVAASTPTKRKRLVDLLLGEKAQSQAVREARTIEAFLKLIELQNHSFSSHIDSLNEKVELDEKQHKNGETRVWLDHESLSRSRVEELNPEEAHFFEQLIEKYLSPNENSDTPKQKARAIENLRDLRNNCSYAYLILNGFWLLIMFTLNLLKPKMIDKIYFDLRFGDNSPSNSTISTTPSTNDVGKYEPVSFCYIMLFVFVLLMQFAAMIWHRVITFTQIIRKTSLIDGLMSRTTRRKPPFVIRREQNGHANGVFEFGEDIDEEEQQHRRESTTNNNNNLSNRKEVVITI